jgi:hypothetical protein
MMKATLISLSNLLRPHIEKLNTNYKAAIPPVTRVACALFKLTQGASLLLVSEFFAVGKSTASGMVRDVVKAVNIEMRHEISWPSGQRLRSGMEDFHEFVGLSGVVSAIDGMHFDVRKLDISPEDYFYF